MTISALAKAHLSSQDPSGLPARQSAECEVDLEFWREAGGSERWAGLLAAPEELAVVRFCSAARSLAGRLLMHS
jgi:hypothetical protein